MDWYISPSEKLSPDEYEYYRGFPLYQYFSKNPLSALFETARNVMEVFKMSKIGIDIDGSECPLGEKTIKWISCSRNQFQVNICILWNANEDTFRVFSENYHTPTDMLNIKVSKKFQKSVLPDDFKLDRWNYVIVDMVFSIHTFALYYIDAPKLFFLFDLSVETRVLGDILKSWQSGKSHSKLRTAHLFLPWFCKIVKSELLEGIEVIESKSVEQYVQLDNELYWLEEEIIINSPNGKLATIQMRQHVGSMEYAKENWHSDYENPVVKQNKVHSNEVYLVVGC
uniref:FBA_2 domain-containing protein n=1 Tax=Caenorhabditis tropicalis TaxID=1561998 RepID=A0A1I7U5H7_9PELO